MSNSNVHTGMRVYHRYLGFFLAGIMAVYAISGVVMIFRDTDFLKSEKMVEKTLAPALQTADLAKALKMRDLKIQKEENDVVYFESGTYNKSTGVARYKTKEWPRLLDKLTRIHKASTKDPLFFLNVFFGLSLLFFVVSSFWMFMPKTRIFQKGLYFTLAGIVLTLVLVFV